MESSEFFDRNKRIIQVREQARHLRVFLVVELDRRIERLITDARKVADENESHALRISLAPLAAMRTQLEKIVADFSAVEQLAADVRDVLRERELAGVPGFIANDMSNRVKGGLR